MRYRSGRVAECNSKTSIHKLKEKLDEEDSKLRPDMNTLKGIKRDLAQAYRDEEVY